MKINNFWRLHMDPEALSNPILLALPTGAKVAVFQVGRGPDLIYLPGSNVDYRLRPGVFTSRLPEFFRVTTLEYRGLARSTGPNGLWKMQDFADDVLQIMSALGIKSASLLGESFGAMVAQWVALTSPELFSRVAYACGSVGGLAGSSFPFHDWLERSPMERAREVLLHVNLGNREIEANDPDKFEEMLNGRLIFEQQFLANLAQREGYRYLLEARAKHDCSASISSLSMPIWIMAGQQDGIAPIANQRAMARLLPSSHFKEFDGGHDFLWSSQHPIDWLLREWA